MSRAILSLPLFAFTLAACGGGPPPPEPEPIVRVDTIVVTREVTAPLPDGRPATVCLGSGQAVQVRVSPAGDTLVGPRRVRLADLGPAIGFVGTYAGNLSWFVNDEPVTFDDRAFSKFGQPTTKDCGAMKIVGDADGVNLFADVAAAAPFRILYVPVRPGVFQPYQAQVGRVRG